MSQGESVDQERPDQSDTDQSTGNIPVNSESEHGGETERDEPKTKEEWKERVETLKEERDEIKEKYLRKVADLDNLRKRTKEEKEKQRKYANKNLLEDLLETLDNFDRALDSMEFESEEVADGIKMIRNQLDDLLSKYQVSKIDAKGEPFDPNYHEGMMQEERDDLDSRKVLEVFQEGYTLHDRVLRPAQVKVGVPSSSNNDSSDMESRQDETAS